LAQRSSWNLVRKCLAERSRMGRRDRRRRSRVGTEA
jgi:hypothetical protein